MAVWVACLTYTVHRLRLPCMLVTEAVVLKVSAALSSRAPFLPPPFLRIPVHKHYHLNWVSCFLRAVCVSCRPEPPSSFHTESHCSLKTPRFWHVASAAAAWPRLPSPGLAWYLALPACNRTCRARMLIRT